MSNPLNLSTPEHVPPTSWPTLTLPLRYHAPGTPPDAPWQHGCVTLTYGNTPERPFYALDIDPFERHIGAYGVSDCQALELALKLAQLLLRARVEDGYVFYDAQGGVLPYPP